MRQSLFLVIVFLFTCKVASSQADSLMKSLARELSVFRPDTTSPPADKKTFLASKLLSYSGILNVNEALSFKRMEARKKKEQSEEEIARAELFFTAGDGNRWLNNAMINIYRSTFTDKELKKLERFFRKGSGEKFVQAFPLVMIKAMVTMEQVSALGGVKL